MNMHTCKNVFFTMLSVTLLTSLSLGCSNTDTNKGVKEGVKTLAEPVELVFYNPGASFGEEGFDEKYGQALRKKFPAYTFKFIPATQHKLQELLVSGTRFDIIFHTIGNFEEAVLPNNLQVDLTDLVKKHNVNLDAIEPTIMAAVKQASGGKLYGLPVFMNNMVTFYNKGLFDKFGVIYPKDGVTWDEMAALSQKLNRVENGVQFYGYSTSVPHMLRMNQFSLPSVAPGTDIPTINNDTRWKTVFDGTVFAPLQGYRDKLKSDKRLPDHTTNFLKDQNLAVYVYQTTLITSYIKELKAMSWDMVAIPTFKELPKVGAQAYPTYFGITKLARNQDAAMEVLKFLVSEEYQKEEGRQGMATILRSESVKNVLLKESEFKDKNLNAIFYYPFAPISPKELYDAQLNTIYSKVSSDILWGGTADVNTALRTAEEQAVKKIVEYKAQLK